MPNLLTITTRITGRKEPAVPDWTIPWPPPDEPEGEPLTLGELITRVVLAEVNAFRQRQRENRFVRVLTERQLEQGLRAGKVDSGGHEAQDVDADAAVGAALQAFEDGLYLVILDGHEQRDLGQQVFVTPNSQLIFLRLVMLAGA